MKRRPIPLSILALSVLVPVGIGSLLLSVRPVAVPGWQAGAVSCRDDPLVHVHHPTRFSLEARCASISGTVKQVKLSEAFGDVKVSIRPDANYRMFLREGNRGIVIAAVIPPDQPFVSIPPPGEHATFYGAWVVDKAQDAVELHPAWHISSADGQVVPPARPVLDVHLGVPKSISIGETLPLWVTVTSSTGEQRRQVSEVRLFAELTSASHGGVDWEAGLTNTRGSERLGFVALQIPGKYEITLYALKDGERGVARANVTVRRR
jgi:hypothetical protein